MVKSKQIVLAIVVLAIVIVAYFIFSLGEAEKVKKQFEFIAEKINKENGESPIIAAAKANKIKEVFTDPFTVQAPAHEVFREASIEARGPTSKKLYARYEHWIPISMGMTNSFIVLMRSGTFPHIQIRADFLSCSPAAEGALTAFTMVPDFR